jgi:NAD-dependent dihydropyrimidine dehydrogenase PreA subunit
MPGALTSAERLSEILGLPRESVITALNALADKGLVVDLDLADRRLYAPSPFIIGIFEFTLMRTAGRLDTKTWARLFHEYLEDGEFWKANCGSGQAISLMRALPQEAALPQGPHVEILDFEKASAIIDQERSRAVSLCACRHEKSHLGTKRCDVPLETCTTFGHAADYLLRHGLARSVSRGEMRELFAASRERRLVFCADNVQRNVAYVCHCCKCCCTALDGIIRKGYPNAVITSGFIARKTSRPCNGCGACAKVCPIAAATIENGTVSLKEQSCLGCGVCVLACTAKALTLERRPQRVIPPETFFEKILLHALERGTLADQLFDDPSRFGQRLLRVFLGSFLRLKPVQRGLAAKSLRSAFLGLLAQGIRRRGLGALLDL